MKKLDLYYKKDTGELFYEDMNCIMANRDFWPIARIELEKMVGPSARYVFYEGAKKATKGAAVMMIKSKKTQFPQITEAELIESMVDKMAKLGYGKAEVVKYEPAEKTIIRLYNSAAMLLHEKLGHPVCDVVSGILAGGSELITKKTAVCKETKCVAKGDPHCEFELSYTDKKPVEFESEVAYVETENLEKETVDYDEENGEVYARGVSTEIHSRDFDAILQQKMESVAGPAVRTLMYKLGEGGAKRTVSKLKKGLIKILGKISKRKLAEELAKEIPMRGMGVAEILEFDEKRQFFRVSIKNSYNAIGYRNEKNPKCHIFSGVLAGAVGVITGTEMVCTETKCVAMGEPHCEFEIEPKQVT